MVEESGLSTKVGKPGQYGDPAVGRLYGLAGLFGAAAADPSLARASTTAEALYAVVSKRKTLDSALLSAQVLCRDATEPRPSDDDVLRFVCHTALELSNGHLKVASKELDFLEPVWWKTVVVLGLGPLAADATGEDALGWNASEISLANHDDDQPRYDDAVAGMMASCARLLTDA